MATVTINRPTVAAADWAGALTHPVSPSMAGVMLTGFALLLLIISGFITLDLPLPGHASTLLVPLSLGIGAFFGMRLGVWAVTAYLLVGLLGWPVFANGGGLGYWQEPGFPYLVALPIATGFSGYFLYQWKLPVFAPVMAVIIPLLLLHTLGAVGLCLQTALGVLDASALPGWINSLSLQVMVSELCLSAVCVWLVAPMARLMVNWLL